MRQIAHSRRAAQRGFSLIEVIFATGILSVSILGLMAMTVTSLKANQRDDRRNDSVRVASETAEVLMAAPFDKVESCELSASSTPGTTPSVPACLGEDIKLFPDSMQSGRIVTNAPGVPYNIRWTVTHLSDDLKQIVITVEDPKNVNQQTHQVTIYKHKVF